ncbi:MAG TPA: hypothetical protein VJG30_00165 [Candidatus Nanoarchaeia archaeon]|nr:hypothetical protein [Candidatus Nanoarchaeia archaeon]
MDDYVKKNILDLNFQKHLIIASTSILISFTYFIGVVIAFMSRQIKLDNLLHIFLIVILSSIILCITIGFFFKSYNHIRKIPQVIKELKLK